MDRYKVAWHSICQILRDFVSVPNFKKTLLWGIVLYGIALFALVRGDIYYMDDLNTSINNISWNHFSRYLGTFILNDLTTFGKGAVDSSPLLQIMAVILAVISSMILLYLIRKKFDLVGIVASLPLGLSPHFLQNLSYKFESLFMCVALFLAIVPFLFKDKPRLFIAISVVSLLCMFMTYQAANATYIILSLFFTFYAYFIEGHGFKESVGFFGICVISLIAVSIYYKMILNPIPFGFRYVSDEMILVNNLFLFGVFKNLITYLTTIFNDFKSTPYIWLIAINCVLFVANIAIYSNRPKIIAICGAIVFIVLGITLSYGLYLVLQKPLFEPRAFYGFNVLVAILAIVNVSFLFCRSDGNEESQKNNRDSSIASLPQNDKIFLHKILRFLPIIIVLITAYFLISFANIYGNALKRQDEYLDFRARLLLSDLSTIVPRGAMVDLRIYVDNHPVAQQFADKYGAIARLIPKVADDHWWFYLRLKHLKAIYNFDNSEICNFMQENFGSEIIYKNTYHEIQKAKSCYIIVMR